MPKHCQALIHPEVVRIPSRKLQLIHAVKKSELAEKFWFETAVLT